MSNFRFTRPNVFPPIIRGLVIINALVYLAQVLLDPRSGDPFNPWLTNKLALYPINSGLFEPYQIATHMFTHGSLGHIFFNMYALWMFGRELENRLGPQRFLLLYFASGIGSALMQLGVQYALGTGAAAIGASGAVMGVAAAFGYLFPNTEFLMFLVPFPVKAKWLVLSYIAIDLFSGITGRADNVAHFAHLGGALTGFILVLIWTKWDRKRFY